MLSIIVVITDIYIYQWQMMLQRIQYILDAHYKINYKNTAILIQQ